MSRSFVNVVVPFGRHCNNNCPTTIFMNNKRLPTILLSTTTTCLAVVPRKRLLHYNNYQCQLFSNINKYRKRIKIPNEAISCFCFDPGRSLLFGREKSRSHNIFISPSLFSCCLVRGMAGHSKWQNIKHIKGAKDKERSLLTSKFANRIRLAVKEGGSDPKFNPKLDRVIAEAKRADMTNSMIENAIKSFDPTVANSSILEVKFIGNCVLVVEIFTHKPQLARNEIQAICKKFGSRIENGCSRDIFEKKGIIHVTTNEKEPNLESALELAIEVGAEDVSVEFMEDKTPFLQFICGPKDLLTVKKGLEEANYNVTYNEYEFLANVTYPLDENGVSSLEKLMEKLTQYPDVVKIFNNAVSLE